MLANESPYTLTHRYIGLTVYLESCIEAPQSNTPSFFATAAGLTSEMHFPASDRLQKREST